MDNKTEQITLPNFCGFIKIWQTNTKTGETELLVDKPNLILYQGADLLSFALAGKQNAAISHLYVGYNNSATGIFTPPTIDKADTNQMVDYSTPFGYLRLPLTFPATFLSEANYNNNTGVYTTVISSGTGMHSSATFTSAGLTPSWIYEIALVAALNDSNDTDDLIFSRANFTPIKYVSGYNLTVSWGVKFLAST